jgi:hypothetical protein
MVGILRSVLTGAAAGAAGTTGLNAVTYMDMAGRGRPVSGAPEDTVDRLVDDWSTKDWAADIVPHLVYGLVTTATLLACDHEEV